MKKYLPLILLIIFSGCVNNKIKEPERKELCSHYNERRYCTNGSSVGECKRGIQTCLEPYWSECVGEIQSTPEVCDGVDNDCDGVVDNGVLNKCGYCGPEPVEVCDQVDNDCDGQIDEELSTIEETCNGIDDDCDGHIDEGYSGDDNGAPGKQFVCVPEGAGNWIKYNTDFEESLCTQGFKVCQNGAWTECTGWVGPKPEICNGLDDDCDGYIDDLDFETECGVSTQGDCRLGVNVCIHGELRCLDAVLPQEESCDIHDNDCDGAIDEDLVSLCETPCGQGLQTCSFGEWVGCTAPQPLPEICDGFDNDCDGLVDEDILCLCENDQIQSCVQEVCGWGTQICIEGQWGECVGQIPQREVCNNHDDNCNQLIDEDLIRECYTADPATLNVGLCHTGRTFCDNGVWSECEDQGLPQEESCNGLDDDCDGAIDNLERYFEKIDLIFAIDLSNSMSPYIEELARAIRTYVTSLQGSAHRFGIVSFGSNIDPQAEILQPLADISTTVETLENMAYSSGSLEPSLDVTLYVSSPYEFFLSTGRYDYVGPSPIQISWRADATPILILFTDEQPQSLNLLFMDPYERLELVRESLSVCFLPGCHNSSNENWIDGDPLEIFVFTRPPYFTTWTIILPETGSRLFELDARSQNGGLGSDLNLIFREVCIY